MSLYLNGNRLNRQSPPATDQYTPDLTRAATRPTMKKQVPPADLALFHEQVQDAQPLREESIEPYRRRPPPIPRPRPLELPEDAGVTLSESEIETHEFLSFARPGVQQRVLAELRRGAIAVGLEVDLHGLTVEIARRVLAEFLLECGHRRVRCARIIHGKGIRSSSAQPVLKQKVNYWLRLHGEVLAFCSATRGDGGTGAVYCLLRNPNKAKRQSGKTAPAGRP
jgi:DNA-nicking Smr family endonuclease